MKDIKVNSGLNWDENSKMKKIIVKKNKKKVKIGKMKIYIYF